MQLQANPPPAKRSRIGEFWTASTASTSSSGGTHKIWCAGSDCSEELQQRTDVFEAIPCGCVFCVRCALPSITVGLPTCPSCGDDVSAISHIALEEVGVFAASNDDRDTEASPLVVDEFLPQDGDYDVLAARHNDYCALGLELATHLPPNLDGCVPDKVFETAVPTLISCHYKYDAHAALLAEEGDDEVGDQATEASPAASSPLCMYANSHVVLVEVEPSNPGEAATVENLSLRAQHIAEVEQQSTEQVENRSSGELARQQGHSMSTDRILRYAFLTSDNLPLVLLHDLKARQPEKQDEGSGR